MLSSFAVWEVKADDFLLVDCDFAVGVKNIGEEIFHTLAVYRGHRRRRRWRRIGTRNEEDGICSDRVRGQVRNSARYFILN